MFHVFPCTHSDTVLFCFFFCVFRCLNKISSRDFLMELHSCNAEIELSALELLHHCSSNSIQVLLHNYFCSLRMCVCERDGIWNNKVYRIKCSRWNKIYLSYEGKYLRIVLTRFLQIIYMLVKSGSLTKTCLTSPRFQSFQRFYLNLP